MCERASGEAKGLKEPHLAFFSMGGAVRGKAKPFYFIPCGEIRLQGGLAWERHLGDAD